MTDPMEAASLDLEFPFTGRWLVQNSPADRVPSHGTTMFATSFSIDFVPVDDAGRSAVFTLGSLVRSEPPENFTGFGRSVLAPTDGTVMTVHDSEFDHPAYRGLPSLGYALTQRRRAEAGWRALAGNHVMIKSSGGIVALCHLQRGSARVRPGQDVHVGQEIGRCGNSGNSTEPHLHVQALDGPDIERAAARRISFRGSLPSNGSIIAV